jgi:hypothetical protein
MEELSVVEIIQGLLKKDFIEYRVQLLQLLINKFAGSEETALVPINNNASAEENTTEQTPAVQLPLNIDHFRLMIRVLVDLIHQYSNLPTLPETAKEIINFSLCTITNATIYQKYTESLLLLLEDSSSPINTRFHQFIKSFLDYNPQLETTEELDQITWELHDEWQYMGSIICNLCQEEKGRKLILNQSYGYMMKLPAQVRASLYGYSSFHVHLYI